MPAARASNFSCSMLLLTIGSSSASKDKSRASARVLGCCARNVKGGPSSMPRGPPPKSATCRRRWKEPCSFLGTRSAESCPAQSAIALCTAVPTTASRPSLRCTCSIDLERLAPLAPLHQPNNLAPIRAILERHPGICRRSPASTPLFIGAIRMLPTASPFPSSLYRGGRSPLWIPRPFVRVHRRAARRIAPEIAKGRVVVAHLGSGASMCALVGGQERGKHDGLHGARWPADGDAAGAARSGRRALSHERKAHERRRRSSTFSTTTAGSRGFRASATMCRDLLASPDPRAKLALDYFVYRIALFTGMLAAAMGGIDGFVFTGRHRRECARHSRGRAAAPLLAWPRAATRRECQGRAHASRARQSRVACYVIPTDEELMIARHTLARAA